MATKNKTAPVDKFDLVTDKVLSLLESGVKPWVKPWVSPKGKVARNLFSSEPYKGVNPMLIAVDCLASGYTFPLFVGFSQAKERGWAIRKGSKSTWICWGGTGVKETTNDQGETQKQFYSAFKWLNVFNIDCLDDSQSDLKIADFLPNDEDDRKSPDPIPDLDAIVKRSGADIRYGGDRAFYTSAGDFIGMPDQTSFKDFIGYYSTLIHELSHWTGHKSRLNRDLDNKFGSMDYAFEELVAEMGSAMVLSHHGLEQSLENHASYIGGWLRVLKQDKRAFIKAAGLASRAATYLLDQDQ